MPFPLKYIEIGNEASGEVYRTNYKLFYDAIHVKYPNVRIISNYKSIPNSVVEIRDDHKYGSPESFINAFNQYDKADRNGPEIYVGEYGCTAGVGQGNLKGALAEAVYLMGLEKNSDIVTMSSYAPLFFNVNDNAWPVNMIGFDNQSVFGRTSYWVNRMMAENRPDVLSNTISADSTKNLFCISGFDRKTNEIVIKVANVGAAPQKVIFRFGKTKLTGSAAEVTTLTHPDFTAENSLYNSNVVIPRKSQIIVLKEDIEKEFSPWSFSILRIKATKSK
jgi:alpha-N-arabinofuranosidase